MGTRSNIGATQEDGTIKVIYCHWDGYPEGVGAVLTEHYTEPAKVQALLNLGDISSLSGTEVENVESYAKRGETDTEARIYFTREEWLKDIEDSGVEFLYIFEDSYGGGYEWNYFPVSHRWTLLKKIEQVANA